jgi:hypothetical protein
LKIEIESKEDAEWFNRTMKIAPQPIEGMTLTIKTKYLVTFPGNPKSLYEAGIDIKRPELMEVY